MGPEIQGGWWKGIPVTTESRQQTYLTVLGHGMKAMFIYYFNEGQNWGPDQGYVSAAKPHETDEGLTPKEDLRSGAT